MLNKITKDLYDLKNPEKALILSSFFKTGKGNYGEGDLFLGITVPEQRKIAKKYQDLGLNEIKTLIQSKFHEFRLTGLLILIEKYKKSNNKKGIFSFYLNNLQKVNNWDLVDLSAPNMIGDFLLDKDKSILHKLARSNNLWEKRISIISTYAFIRKNKFEDALKISKILLKDKHDLIHKAVGWMLREIGKRNQELEEKFLNENYKDIPRTALRYAIERFDEKKKQFYLKKINKSQNL